MNRPVCNNFQNIDGNKTGRLVYECATEVEVIYV